MSVTGRVSNTVDMLPIWMATESLWRTQAKEKGSHAADFSLIISSSGSNEDGLRTMVNERQARELRMARRIRE